MRRNAPNQAEPIIRRTYKYRLYPSKAQRSIITEHLALCCELYNAALQERRDAWKLNHISIKLNAQTAQLPEIKIARPELTLVYAQVLQNTLRRLDRRFRAFFGRVERKEKPGYPRFRSLHQYDSLTYPQQGFWIEDRHLRVTKIGRIKIKLHRPIMGTVKTLTIKREANRWFAIFVCQTEPQPLPFSPRTVGIDVGLASFATFSDGTEIPNPHWNRESETSVRVVQRKVSRRKKGSNRRRKAVQLLQRAHAHIRRQRADFHHKLSRRLVNNFGLIAVEDLNVKGLAGGMLSKSVRDAGWSSFLSMLAYKAESAGRVLIRVDPRGTSQTCICGAEVRKTLANRWHLCLNCGLSLPRDHVSAQIIQGLGLSLQDSTWAAAPCVS